MSIRHNPCSNGADDVVNEEIKIRTQERKRDKGQCSFQWNLIGKAPNVWGESEESSWRGDICDSSHTGEG